jgi:hypothetical protein
MKVVRTPERASLALIHLLAQLLERIEANPAPVGAEQYRSVVRHLGVEIASLGSAEGLSALLDAHPAAAQLYENINYQHAGLCRSPLERALNAELQARALIERARQPR